MLLVSASAKQSSIDGLGLFADEKIPKGTIVWRFNSRFDILFTIEEVEQLPSLQNELVKEYAYLSKVLGKYVYSIDDSRFTNHSIEKGNLDVVMFPNEIETCGVANRDIDIGEEILINYREFDVNDEKSDEEYLKS